MLLLNNSAKNTYYLFLTFLEYWSDGVLERCGKVNTPALQHSDNYQLLKSLTIECVT